MSGFPAFLLEGYKSFMAQRFAPEQSRYKSLADKGQQPTTMIIACCDSRAAPETIFDAGPGERDDFRAALSYVAERFPDLPIWAGGMSFGSWIGLTVGAADPRVSLLLGVAMPVNNYDYAAVRDSDKPKFFIHGEFDEICSIHDVRAFYAQANEPKELIVIEASDHLFDGKVSQVGDAVEDLLSDWPED